MRCLSRLAFLCLLLADAVLHLAVRVTARQVSVLAAHHVCLQDSARVLRFQQVIHQASEVILRILGYLAHPHVSDVALLCLLLSGRW